jgi:hypothetical protein
MDWSSFQTHGDTPQAAFEAFVGHLFERWVRREYGELVSTVVFVDGSGGDGGTEAYAPLADGRLVGDQAKWFREHLGDSEFGQIERSIRTATKVRKGLTHYVVAVPTDLPDPKDAPKNGHAPRRQKSARDRWNDLRDAIAKDHPRLTLELWDETRLEELLAELTSDGLRQFWFSKSAFSPGLLRRRFELATASWLRNRYLPDLHVVGELEADLRLRLEDADERRRVLQLIVRAKAELAGIRNRLGHLPNDEHYGQVQNASALLPAAINALDNAEAAISRIATQLEAGVALADLRGLAVPEVSPRTQPLAAAIESVGDRWLVRPLIRHFATDLERAASVVWRMVSLTRDIQQLSLPVLYLGEPGCGKTHALAHATEGRLAQATPALLIRARDVAPAGSWGDILRAHLDLPNWTAEDVLDCLESTAAMHDVARIRSGDHAGTQTPVLIAVDGLDESTASRANWRTRLSELAAISHKHRRIRIAVTCRAQVAGDFGDGQVAESFSLKWLSGSSDAPLDELFRRYTSESGVRCPALFRWYLRSPLEVRLFGELFAGQELSAAHPDILSLPSLIDLKLSKVEEEVRLRLGERWSPDTKVVGLLLLVVAQELARTGAAVETEMIAVRFAERLKPRGLLTPGDTVALLEACSEAGLLLKRIQSSEDEFAPGLVLWEPALQSVGDFLLGRALADRTLGSKFTRRLPKWMRRGLRWVATRVLRRRDTKADLLELLWRGGASQIAATLLAQQGFNVCDTPPWVDVLAPHDLERLHLAALPSIAADGAKQQQDWVAARMVASMPSCRRVLRATVIPVLRLPDHPLGARLVDRVLREHRVADRDLFWSGPPDIARNHGGKWEGHGEEALEDVRLEPTERWDQAPLLMAWGLATVVLGERLRRREELAKWGAANPEGLLLLMKHFEHHDDPQVLEDLSWAAYGASTLATACEKWGDLCAWLSASDYMRLDSAAVRHAARGLIARCAFTGAAGAQPPPPAPGDPGRYLELDVAAASTDHCDNGLGGLVSYDLARYVAIDATDPFFADWLVQDHSSSSGYSGPRRALLDLHAQRLGRKSLIPGQLILGHVVHRARSLGWNEALFHGDPRGGEAGERLGADVAILRQYSQATHGERSGVATFIDKYVRSSVDELVGYLADRLPALDESRSVLDPPVDVALVSRPLPNPAALDGADPDDDNGHADSTASPWLPRSLAPSGDPDGTPTRERAIALAECEPIPPLNPCLLVTGTSLGLNDPVDWLTLSAFFINRSFPVPVDAAVWVSAYAVDDTLSLETLRDLAQHQSAELRWAEQKATIASARFYVDPVEVLWAPWLSDRDGNLPIGSKSEAPSPLVLECLATEAYWSTGTEERRLWVPGEHLRRDLCLVAVKSGVITDKKGRVVAAHKRHGRSWGEYPHGEVLVARREELEQHLSRRRRKLVWAVRFFREPAPELNAEQPDGSWPAHIELDVSLWGELATIGPRLIEADRGLHKRAPVPSKHANRR